MSRSFFVDLGMPQPDIDLEVGSGSHAEQTARIMVEFEKVCLRERPDLVIVVGDVNSTMACTHHREEAGHRGRARRSRAAVARHGDARRDQPPVHRRALRLPVHDRSFRRTTTCAPKAIAAEKVFFVGNVMIDTLLKHKADGGAA